MTTLKSATELGFIPKYQPMSVEQTELFLKVYLSNDMKRIPDKEAPFLLKILRKRIEVLKLPIEFTPQAELLSFIMADGNPGKVMLILIELIDNYFKTRKVKWSEIY